MTLKFMPVFDLVDRYFGEIEIEYTNYELYDETTYDAADIELLIPVQMILDYQIANNVFDASLPDAVEFWEENGLASRLIGSGKPVRRQHQPLDDIVELLNGDVEITGGFYSARKGMIRLCITEFPEQEEY
jgi:hypothetical protein